ncbi:MAG: flagellar filament capping protein FliD [Pirellulales bacterium]|nr:flagellar filament capping protein FliD [Pirellulales bacterium]
MGRIQSSVGLITGTDIAGTVDQLIAISARPRDRLVARTDTLGEEQKAIAELTAAVIGVQLAGNQLASTSTFRSRQAESSNSDALSATAGNSTPPASYLVRTLQTAATHRVDSLQRFDAADTALGFTGTLTLQPAGGFLDESARLSDLNGGRGVELGTIRITDRSGATADISLSDARTVDDVLNAINDAGVSVRASTSGNAFVLTDLTGSTNSNLIVEQLGGAETTADLGLFGVNTASNSVTGNTIDLAAGVSSLRGVPLSELNGGTGLGALTNLDITLSDGSSASIDLSSATTTSEVIDLIEASGLSLIARLNDAQNGFRIRDVSGGAGTFSISSVDSTAAALGIEASTTDDIVVGADLNRQSITTATLLADLNQGQGINSGSFTVTDSAGNVGAINLAVEGITTVGGLIDAINNLGIGVSASVSEGGDGIQVIDTAGGASTLTISDTGSGTVAADLGIAGTATDQLIGGITQSALVGTQADTIQVEATDTLSSIVSKINEQGRYGDASVALNDDGTFSLRVRSRRGGEAGRIAINTQGFNLDLRTSTRGQDALIAVSTDNGVEQFLTSSDGVFEIDGSDSASKVVTSATLLADLNSGAGIDLGSFTVTDSAGAVSAVNLTVENITTVGGLVDAINNLGLGVTASVNEAGTGIAVVDTAGGSGTLTITDTGNRTTAADLGIAGTATSQTIGGSTVSALVGPNAEAATQSDAGLVLTLKELSASPITVTVSEDPDAVVSATQTFVEQFNNLVDKLDSLTFFNSDSDEVGLLFGSSEALRIENGYSRLLSGAIVGAGDLRSIGQVGLSLNDQGKLDLSSSELSTALSENSADVEAFFTTDEFGLADRLNALADRIAGETNSLLINRTNTLTTQIERNNERIDALNLRLENERERLLNQFISTEEAIAKIQSNQSFISQIQRISIPQAQSS